MQCKPSNDIAAIAQLGERQTEDLKVPGSIPGLGIARFGCFGSNCHIGKSSIAQNETPA